MAIILYSQKGSDLTWDDFDNNFIDLNTRIGTLESASSNQSLSLTGSNLTISNGNTVNLNGIVAAAGGIQSLSITNQTLSISGGNSIDLSAAIAAGGGLQTLNLNGSALTITGGNTIDLSGLIAAAAGVQSLSFTGNLLSISGSNSVDLSSLVDSTKQSISVSNGVLSISDGNSILLPNQSLTLTNNQLSISGGNSVNLSAYANEAPQSLTLDGTSLSISGSNTIDLTPIINLASGNAGTDSQTLALNGTNLSISGGNTVDLSTLDITQNLTLSNNVLRITGGNSINLNEYKQTLSTSGTSISISEGNSVNIQPIVNAAVSAAFDAGIGGSGTSAGTVDTGFTLDTELNILAYNGDTVNLSHYSNTDEQLLHLSGSTITITNGNSIDLSGLLSGATNGAVQTISLVGNNLSISNGNTVNLSSILDNVAAQSLSLVGNNLSISGGNTIDLTAFKDEVKQTLGLIGSQLTISGGNQIDLAPLISSMSGQVEYSATVDFTGNTLTIDGTAVDLSQFENSDEQMLSLQGGMLTITNGNSVDLGSLITQINSGNTYNYNDLINKPTSILDFGISDGSAGQVLVTNGAGQFSFESMGGAGGSANLALNGTVLSIVGGNGVDLAPILGNSDLSDYYTKQEIDTALSNINIDTTGLATTQYVDSAILSINQQLNGYATEAWVTGQVSTQLTGYATQNWVTDQLSNVSTASTLDEILANGNTTDRNIITSGKFMTYAYVNTDNGSIIAGAVDSTDDWGFITDTATYSADYGTITLADGTTGSLQPVDVLELANAYADALLANAGSATTIDDLTDVKTSGTGHVPSDGQALVWNASHGHWMPGTVSAVNTNTESTVNVTTTAQTTFDTWSMDTYRSADYHITVSSASGYSMMKISVLHDGTNIYTDLYTSIGSDTGDLNISAESGNVVFKFTPLSAPTEIKFIREAVTNSDSFGGGTGQVCQTLTFPIDLNSDSLGVLDLASGDAVIDLQTGTNTGQVCDGGTGTTTEVCQSLTFPIDLSIDALGVLDLESGNAVIDLQTGTNTGQVCDGGSGTGGGAGGTTSTFTFPVNLNDQAGTFDAMDGTGNIDLEAGINTGVFN